MSSIMDAASSPRWSTKSSGVAPYLRIVLRKSSLTNKDKAGHKTGAHQARRIFQDCLLSKVAVILAVGLPLPLAVFWIWLSVDAVYRIHWSAVKPEAMIRSARGPCGCLL